MTKVKQPAQSADSTRDQIKKAARVLFIRKGLEGVSYADIAEVVGTTRANLHYHFGSKAQLVEEVFEETFAEVNERYRDIWLTPNISFDQRLGRMLDDVRQRFYEFNDHVKGRAPWSLTARARYENSFLSDSVKAGIADMSRQFEEFVTHGVRLAIGCGELRPDTPVRAVVLLVAPLFYFGSPITQFGGMGKLEEHYQAVRGVIRDAYGTGRKDESVG